MMRRRAFIAGLGSALTFPILAKAQPQTTPSVGFLFAGLPEKSLFMADAFRRGLAEMNYAEGKNLIIEYRWAERYELLPAQAVDLVSRKVNAIFASSLSAGFAAKNATKSIPIVFTSGGDPVDAGLVTSLNQPGENITGISQMTQKLVPKRLELLREVLPQATVFSMLVNPAARSTKPAIAEATTAARSVGVQLHFHEAKDQEGITNAFLEYRNVGAKGLLVNPDPLFLDQRDLILKIASQEKVPIIHFDRVFAASGGLMSYAASLAEIYRKAGVYVGRILKGEKAADLPVQQPTQFELVINLKTARELALNIPATLLASADEVIE